MIIVIYIIVVFCAFLLGFYAGKNKMFKNPSSAAKQQAEIIKLRQEFENFLNYDGSQQ